MPTADTTASNIEDPGALGLQPVFSTVSVFTRDCSIKLMEQGGVVLRERIGSGTYSTVKKAWLKEKSETHPKSGGKWVAVKVIDRRKVRKDFCDRFLPRELEIIKQLQHPNVIQTIDLYDIDDSIVYIVEELADRGDLLQLVKSKNRIPEAEAKQIFRQLFEALHYLHDKLSVAHRDLKCENVLFDFYKNVKLCDFGFACKMSPGYVSNTFCGSRAYAAPEILTCTPYSGCSIDIWSAGVVLYVSLTGYMLYDDKDKPNMIKKQQERTIKYPRNVSSSISADAKELIYDLLNPKSKDRLTYLQIINSKWLKDTPWEHRLEKVLYRMQNAPLKPATVTKKSSSDDTLTDGRGS